MYMRTKPLKIISKNKKELKSKCYKNTKKSLRSQIGGERYTYQSNPYICVNMLSDELSLKRSTDATESFYLNCRGKHILVDNINELYYDTNSKPVIILEDTSFCLVKIHKNTSSKKYDDGYRYIVEEIEDSDIIEDILTNIKLHNTNDNDNGNGNGNGNNVNTSPNYLKLLIKKLESVFSSLKNFNNRNSIDTRMFNFIVKLEQKLKLKIFDFRHNSFLDLQQMSYKHYFEDTGIIKLESLPKRLKGATNVFSTNIFIPMENNVGSDKQITYYLGLVKLVETFNKMRSGLKKDFKLVIYYDDMFNHNYDDNIYKHHSTNNNINKNIKAYYEKFKDNLLKKYFTLIKNYLNRIKNDKTETYRNIILYSYNFSEFTRKQKGYLGHPSTFGSILRYMPFFIKQFNYVFTINASHALTTGMVELVNDWINSGKTFTSFTNTDNFNYKHDYQFDEYDKIIKKIGRNLGFKNFYQRELSNNSYVSEDEDNDPPFLRPFAGIFGYCKSSINNFSENPSDYRISCQLFNKLVDIVIKNYNNKDKYQDSNRRGRKIDNWNLCIYGIDEYILSIISLVPYTIKLSNHGRITLDNKNIHTWKDESKDGETDKNSISNIGDIYKKDSKEGEILNYKNVKYMCLVNISKNLLGYHKFLSRSLLNLELNEGGSPRMNKIRSIIDKELNKKYDLLAVLCSYENKPIMSINLEIFQSESFALYFMPRPTNNDNEDNRKENIEKAKKIEELKQYYTIIDEKTMSVDELEKVIIPYYKSLVPQVNCKGIIGEKVNTKTKRRKCQEKCGGYVLSTKRKSKKIYKCIAR
jgi:hypothetical protein